MKCKTDCSSAEYPRSKTSIASLSLYEDILALKIVVPVILLLQQLLKVFWRVS